jgi:catechol 2,3-dioxygenase-like lactoylglutathione lyase family enzyme
MRPFVAWGLVVFALGLLLGRIPALSAVREVGSIGITVGNLDAEVRFFTQDLPFEEISRSEVKGHALDQLLDLPGARVRNVELKLGEERVTLTEHLAHKSRPLPPDSRSYDHWFQHIAIVVSDIDRAYDELRRHKVKHVSTRPQTLPAWNPNAAGIKAFYFRDPEDHILELIQFPPGKGDPKWQRAAGKLFLGIDHTAIVVSDTEASLAFYEKDLGMRVAGHSENYGVEQEHLNQVFGARLRITALRADKGPGIEFLEYIAPPGGRPLPAGSRANDLSFWRTTLLADQVSELAVSLQNQHARFVSKSNASPAGAAQDPLRTFIVRDPDGHALQVIENRAAPGLSISTR